MAWWVAGALGLLALLFFRLYWRAISEARQIVNLLVMVLLDDSVRNAQRGAILDYVSRSDAKNAYALGAAVNQVIPDHAMQMRDSIAGAAGLLWKAKSGSVNKS